MEEKMKLITVPNRDSAGWLHGTKNIRALWVCPACKEPMGEPRLQNFCEDGEFFNVHVWENKCGHFTKYTELTLIEPGGIVSDN